MASPRYVRCIAFDPAPSTVFFISTKLPTFARVADARFLAQMRERADARVVCDPAIR